MVKVWFVAAVLAVLFHFALHFAIEQPKVPAIAVRDGNRVERNQVQVKLKTIEEVLHYERKCRSGRFRCEFDGDLAKELARIRMQTENERGVGKRVVRILKQAFSLTGTNQAEVLERFQNNFDLR